MNNKTVRTVSVLMAAILAGCASGPSPEQQAQWARERIERQAKQQQDVMRLAEPVPTELVAASKTAFDGGLKFFIWRDGEGTVVIPPNGDQRIKIHFAVAHGAKPSPFIAMLRMNARVSGTNDLSTIMTHAESPGEVIPEVLIKNQGPRRFKGEGTHEVYFVPYESMGGDLRYIVPVSNIIKLRVAFQ